MTSEKLEYDSAIGGHVPIPDAIQTYHYAAERADEVRKLINEIQNPSNTKLAFQTLPKHMRRRAMSHHPKRLPRRYRGIHESQMSKAGNPQSTKRPSRKFRRKPSNLLKEYIRRQQKNIWLETHIWHAKRFHMIPKWGYKLPLASCAKTFRASYRASSSHCLIQDVSYLGCLEVKGPLDDLKVGFDKMTNSKCGLGITAKLYTSGKREGTVHLFKAGQYPHGALGTISFIWKPMESFLEISRTLWIFAHPSIYREVAKELISVFRLASDQNQVMEEDADGQTRTITKTVAYARCPSYSNADTNISLTELKDTLNRYRLTGPLSQSVLVSAMKCKGLRPNEPENWFKELQNNEKLSKAHQLQTEFWDDCKGITSPAMLIPNMVLGLNIEDPRLNRPKKRTKALPELQPVNRSMFLALPEDLALSFIWDSDTRTNLTKTMLSNHEFCKKRSEDAIIPGDRCRFEDEMQPVPILLIQRPGSQNNFYKKLGYGCGWDVIVPSGYGMPLWLCLIMWGARPGGLREMNSIAKESGNDENLPDTLIARKERAEKFRELRDKYFRLPPNKRVNYRRLGIASPFECSFKKLVSEWRMPPSAGTEDFHVLREKQLLDDIATALHRNQNLPNLPEDCLVPIYLKMKSRGNPGDFSVICLPKSRDLKHALKQQKFFNKKPVHVEPLHNDCNENTRKKLRKEHKKLLKRLRNRRVREKRRKQETSDKRIKIRPPGTSAIVAEQFKKMCELWLPNAQSSIRYQCSREVFGYVTQSSFSFTEANVTAIGYITAQGLKRLLAVCKGRGEKMVLIRGTKSRNYRLANFKINCSV
ncbi:unnamed protein product [Hermetia illucens]|uniref:Uncharacterized protein n=1 Tax=Hermetia illucens TaxID=343691 RepID=A0A7R8YQD5_HERIL|nr:ribonucleases P/MRP protein subunit POP1 [Hermetia illucens]CAD7081256.1 unnamed protein product [Hermetia illucens]